MKRGFVYLHALDLLACNHSVMLVFMSMQFDEESS